MSQITINLMTLYKFLALRLQSMAVATDLVVGGGHSPSLLHAAFEPPLKEEFARSYTLLSLSNAFFRSFSARDNARTKQHAPKNQMGNHYDL